ncbi:MAG TPA: pitrilysin family protein [Chitinophagaceae bacterium]|nr:pitrilysin family protein [Chitinophagaceae bacterium]
MNKTGSTASSRQQVNMPDRTIAPPIKDAIDFNLQLKPYNKFTLDNGIEVYAIDAGAEEVLQIEWVFFAGNWYEEQNMVAAATNYLLKNGTAQKSAFEVNEHFEYYGAYLNRGCYNENAGLSLHCLNKHTASLLPVVQELISESVFPEDEVQLYKQNNKQRLSVNLKKSEFVAGRLIDEYVFGIDHPYGKYSTAAAYDAIERPALQQFYDKHYRQSKYIIFIAGKLPKDIESQLNKNFGQHAVNVNGYDIDYPIRSAAEKKYRVINDEEGVQGSIRMSRLFPNRHHPDYTKATVLNNVFGGFFGSRLMSNIREDKGYTYGIHSYILNHQHESAWMISTEAGRDVCEATIKEVYKEMEALKNKPVDDEELLLVKNYMLGSTLGDLDGPFHIIGKWKNIILQQLPGHYFYDSVAAIKAVTAKELQELANKYFVANDFYELVVI